MARKLDIMASNVTNRVILPNKKEIYVSDDLYGDVRINEIYKLHGNCKVECCYKDSGKSLQQLGAYYIAWTRKNIPF